MLQFNETNSLIKKYLESSGYKKEKEWPLYLSESKPPFFCFSPFLAAEDKFINLSMDKFYIDQTCFRYNDIDNIKGSPLALPLQKNIGFYRTSFVEIKDVLGEMRYLFKMLGLDLTKLYIVVNENHEDVIDIASSVFDQVIPFLEQDLRADNVPLTKNAYYMRFVYHYNEGVIGLANIVLLNRLNGIAKIDGIIFTERIHFILNNVFSVYETDLYQNSYKVLSEMFGDDHQKFVILSNIKSAITLLSLDCPITGKGAGHNLKKLIKDSSISSLLMGKVLSRVDCQQIVEAVEKDSIVLSEENRTLIIDYLFNDIQRNNQLLVNFKEFVSNYPIRDLEETIEFWKSTYGLNEKLLSHSLSSFQSKSKLVGAAGEIKNGFWGYTFLENSIKNPFEFYANKSSIVKEKLL